ncbi:MAG: prepilin-type N-terminal cleavage/methylation domain-containing protein [Candidatus Niyogibacteria bacterium]|nr:prepilin-type N-terminal cleavage/methylation domain-containing protein [Candidatus Niyogibacteria bacterium]
MNRGFTLLEMTVTIGVAAMISSLILANFPQFSRRLELSRTAQAVARSFREAETAALAVREFNGMFPPYGLHFENGAAIRDYVLFADVNNTDADPEPEGNGLYDEGELVETFAITGAPVIAGICVGVRSGGSTCDSSMLDIVFRRPNPDVVITADGDPSFFNAEITIKIPTGECRRVVIWKTGQLSIEPIEIPCSL